MRPITTLADHRPTPSEPLLLNSRDAARLLAISERKLFDLPIPRVKLGRSVRYDRADLVNWIEKQKQTR